LEGTIYYELQPAKTEVFELFVSYWLNNCYPSWALESSNHQLVLISAAYQSQLGVRSFPSKW